MCDGCAWSDVHVKQQHRCKVTSEYHYWGYDDEAVVTLVVIPAQVVRISESTVRRWKIVHLLMQLTPDDVRISVDTEDILRPCGWDLTVAVCEIFSDLDKIIQGRSIY